MHIEEATNLKTTAPLNENRPAKAPNTCIKAHLHALCRKIDPNKGSLSRFLPGDHFFIKVK
jgi:hypothetical protein